VPRPLVASAWPEATPRSAAAPSWTRLGFPLHVGSAGGGRRWGAVDLS
jgi:hypothetical protein